MTHIASLQEEINSIKTLGPEPAIITLTTIAETLSTNDIDPNSIVADVPVEFIDDEGSSIYYSQAMSLLMLAMMFGKTKLADKLITAGADINFVVNPIEPTLGHTALTMAIYCGWIKSAIWLVEKGANVTDADPHGNTPLHKLAALSDSLFQANLNEIQTLTQKMLKKGALPQTKNLEGKTALDISESTEKLLLTDELKKVSLAKTPREQSVYQMTPLSVCGSQFHAHPSTKGTIATENTIPRRVFRA